MPAEEQEILDLLEELIGDESPRIKTLLRTHAGGEGLLAGGVKERMLRRSVGSLMERGGTDTRTSGYARGADPGLVRQHIRGSAMKRYVQPLLDAKRSVGKDFEGIVKYAERFGNSVQGQPAAHRAMYNLHVLDNEVTRRGSVFKRLAKMLRQLGLSKGGSGPLIMLALASGILPMLMGGDDE